MAPLPLLTFDQQRQALCFDYIGHNAVVIAQSLEHRVAPVRLFLSDPEHYGKRRSPGRPRKCAKADLRRIKYEISKENATRSSVCRKLRLPVLHTTVWREVRRCGQLSYRKMQKGLDLTQHHRAARLKWCFEKVGFDDDWQLMNVSDEKKWNRDGPDVLKYYWHGLGKQLRISISLHSCGGSIIVWGAISARGKSELAVIIGNMNSSKYLEVLEWYLRPFIYSTYGL